VPEPADVTALDADPVRCLDADASKAMQAEIDQAHKDGDTLGGVVEVVVHGLPPGLGSHVHWDRRIDAKLAGALMGIQAIKGVEVGDGFELAATPGSRAHDEIVPTGDGIRRVSGHSGGTEGGMTTGEVLRVRAAMKPIATVPRALRTVDVTTGGEAVAHHQRSDVCAVPAAAIVAEAMVALVLADAVLEKFGGDAVTETRSARRGRGVVCRHVRRADAAKRVGLGVGRPLLLGNVRSRIKALLAAAWGTSARDTDADVEAAEGRTISDIFVDSGEEHFRALERAAVERALVEHDGVLALGGGAVLDPTTRDLLAGHRVVFLRVGLSEAVKRVGLGSARPLLLGNVRGRIKALLDERTPVYESVATHVVDTDGRTPLEVAADIQELFQ
jgi:shikimate kinase